MLKARTQDDMKKSKSLKEPGRGDEQKVAADRPARSSMLRRSTARLWIVGLAFALLGAAACGSRVNGSNPVVCGVGTVLQGAECVPALGSDAGAGGAAGCRGAHCDGAGNAAAGPLDAGTAGVLQGGQPSAGEGGGHEAGGDAGAGDAGGPPAGGADSVGGAGGAPATSHWLAFTDAEGTFAYDVNKFPNSDALVQLATGKSYFCAWSADGRKLIYSYNVDGRYPLYVVDMSEKAPGEPMRLLKDGGSDSAWAADSRSIASAYGATLSVFDPTRADPAVHIVTTTLKDGPPPVGGFTWAPMGHQLFYTDATGSHVVDVVAGVPGVSHAVARQITTWSPNGLALAVSTNGNIYLTDLSGDTPVTATLTTPTIANPTIGKFEFSPDGSKIAFTGAQEREQEDTYVVEVSGTPKPPTRLYPTLPNTAHAHLEVTDVTSPYTTAWSPDGRWLLFYVSDDETLASNMYAVDVAGAAPAAPVKFESTYSRFRWSHSGERLFVTIQGSAPAQIFMLNVLTPQAEPLSLYSGGAFDRFDVSPSGRVLSYSTGSHIFWLDLAAPQSPATDISLAGNINNPGYWGWSPDGDFLAAVESFTNPKQSQLRLIRANGATPSQPLDLKSASSVLEDFVWQPKLSPAP